MPTMVSGGGDGSWFLRPNSLLKRDKFACVFN